MSGLEKQAKTLKQLLDEYCISYHFKGWAGNKQLILSQTFIPTVVVQKLEEDRDTWKIAAVSNDKEKIFFMNLKDKLEEENEAFKIAYQALYDLHQDLTKQWENIETENKQLKAPITYEITTDDGKKTTITVKSYAEIKNALMKTLQQHEEALKILNEITELIENAPVPIEEAMNIIQTKTKQVRAVLKGKVGKEEVEK